MSMSSDPPSPDHTNPDHTDPSRTDADRMDSGGTQELIHRYLEGLSSAAELADLERLLAVDPAAADMFAESARLHAGLQGYFQRQYRMNQAGALLGGDLPPAQAATTGSTFVPQFGGPRAARSADREPRTAGRWKWIAAAVLLLAVGIAAWTSRDTGAARLRLVSGRVTAHGRELADIPPHVQFEVAGQEPAVIEFPDGTRMELAAATVAGFRREPQRFVLEVASGGGRFGVPPGGPVLRVETQLGAVTTAGGRFTLDLVTTPPPGISPTIPLPLPRLAVVVADGSVTVEQAGVVTILAAGEQRVFVNST